MFCCLISAFFFSTSLFKTIAFSSASLFFLVIIQNDPEVIPTVSSTSTAMMLALQPLFFFGT